MVSVGTTSKFLQRTIVRQDGQEMAEESRVLEISRPDWNTLVAISISSGGNVRIIIFFIETAKQKVHLNFLKGIYVE